MLRGGRGQFSMYGEPLRLNREVESFLLFCTCLELSIMQSWKTDDKFRSMLASHITANLINGRHAWKSRTK